MSFTTIEGCRLAYRLKRVGLERFVFVHGLGASKNSFDCCFDMESFSGFTLATIDLPGCGESGWPEDFSYTMKAKANLVLEWVKDLGLTQIILVGHSMGGVICLYMAEALGAKAKAFVNLEGNLGRNDCTFSARVAAGRRGEFETKGFEQFKTDLEKAVQEDASIGLDNYYHNVIKADPRGLYLSSASLVKESCRGNLKERFVNLSLKKWYVFGERSVNPATRHFLEERDVPYFIVPQSGHFMMDDQPTLFYHMLFRALGYKG